MDSINENQPEQNHENLSASEAVKKIRTLVNKADTCFFCTASHSGGSNGVRPMSIQEVDEEGTLWFLSASDSHKDQEIALDPSVKLYFRGSGHSDFLYISGHAAVSKDRSRIKELWSPFLKVWFTGGEDDPRISVIRVEPVEGYYWDNKHGNAVAAAKMLFGAVVGKTFDDSIEGTLSV